MVNLNLLIIMPICVIGLILFIANNYKLNYNLEKTNNLIYVRLVEKNHFAIPYVLRKYYNNISNITTNLFYFLGSSSFWHNINEYENKQLKIQREKYINNIIKKLGIFFSLILYGLILIVWFKFNHNTGHYQLLTDFGSYEWISNFNIILGLDGISLPFILLVGFITPLVYLSNWSTIDSMEIYYILIIILLELFLLIVFLVIDLIMFYIFFESILPPLFVLIGLYGASQKFRAGYYLFLYTLFGSLFMLLSFIKVGGDTGSTFFESFSNDNFYQLFQELIWLVLFISFSVKTPLIPVHIWLPLAHSDANVSGSIILASIVLKLALYGFIRILINIFSSGTSKLTPFFYALCSLSILYASSTTIRQFDLKVIVAYSSIAHMASSLLGTFSDTLYGIIGSIIFGLAHGFVSPGLFILVGAILYDRCGSRIINYYRGLTNLTPLFAFIFLLFIFGNMGVPLTGNFIGEFLSLLGAYQQNIFITSIGATSIILSAVYSIYMYNRISSGLLSPYIFTIPDMFRKEFYIILPLLVLTIILGIYPYFISLNIEFGLSHSLLFFVSPIVFSKSRNQWTSHDIHQGNSNPHNTPVLNNTIPASSSTNSSNINSSTIENLPIYYNIDRNILNGSNLTEVGNPFSEEGRTPLVSLNNRKNKGVDSDQLNDKLVEHLINTEWEEFRNGMNNNNNNNNNNNDNENNNSNINNDNSYNQIENQAGIEYQNEINQNETNQNETENRVRDENRDEADNSDSDTVVDDIDLRDLEDWSSKPEKKSVSETDFNSSDELNWDEDIVNINNEELTNSEENVKNNNHINNNNNNYNNSNYENIININNDNNNCSTYNIFTENEGINYFSEDEFMFSYNYLMYALNIISEILIIGLLGLTVSYFASLIITIFSYYKYCIIFINVKNLFELYWVKFKFRK